MVLCFHQYACNIASRKMYKIDISAGLMSACNYLDLWCWPYAWIFHFHKVAHAHFAKQRLAMESAFDILKVPQAELLITWPEPEITVSSPSPSHKYCSQICIHKYIDPAHLDLHEFKCFLHSSAGRSVFPMSMVFFIFIWQGRGSALRLRRWMRFWKVWRPWDSARVGKDVSRKHSQVCGAGAVTLSIFECVLSEFEVYMCLKTCDGVLALPWLHSTDRPARAGRPALCWPSAFMVLTFYVRCDSFDFALFTWVTDVSSNGSKPQWQD